MERSFGLFFFLKKPKGYRKTGEFPVYIRITVNGKSFELSTKRKCAHEKWNQDAGRMNGKGEVVKTFNAYLDTFQQKVYETKRQLMEQDRPINCDNLKTLLTGKELNEEKHMVLQIFTRHNEQMEALVPKEYASGTLARYKTSLRHTKAFIWWKYKLEDIELGKLNYEFIEDYHFWLKSVRKCGHNSAIKYLSNFRKIIKKCLRSGWIDKDPFLGFNMAKKEVTRTALTNEEIKAIASKEFTITRLVVVRDIFLFSCYSGLAYADVKKLKRSELVTGVDGNLWIICKRQKTDVPSRVPILPVAESILKKYEQNMECKQKDILLPVLSNQKMNAYLKEIADLCSVHKTLTYHIARHTFATTITLSNGVPIETVSKMLGHKNLHTTQHYAKILDHKISKDMQHLYQKFS